MRMDAQDIFIGVDLGGTHVRAASIDGEGRLYAQREAFIRAAEGPDAGLNKISTLIDGVLAETPRPVLAIGIGSTGPLDRARGCIQNPYTLPGWEDVDIVSPLRARFGVPVTLENDADAAGLGEAWMGAGVGAHSLLMVTIGTGVGTAFVLDGRIYRGVQGEHPEGGHILIDPNGPACYCGGHGCLESLVAGPAIAARAVEIASQSAFLQEKTGGDLSRLDAKLVFEGARQADKTCRALVTQVGEQIGLGLVSMMMLMLPDRILLSGGVLRSYDLLEEIIQGVIARHDIIIPTKKVEIQFARLGQRAGLYGAVRAAQIFMNKGTV